MSTEVHNNWWQLNTEEVISILQTDSSTGLTDEQAIARLQQYGPNQLKEKPGRGPFRIFLDQFKDFIVWILVAASVVSGVLGEWIDSCAIVAIVILNAVLGFIQEFRAEKSLAALKKLASPTTRVLRQGRMITIPSSELVPGDIVELEAGDNVPADSRVLRGTSNFCVQEASLTGESTPVLKTAVALQEKDVPLADRANMVYMGTSIAGGKAKVLVVETAMRTELGKIAGMIQEIEHQSTPLQKKLEEFGKWIVYLCFVLVGLLFVLELLRGGKIMEVFLTAVSLAVAAIPEGLPAAVTISLALGVQRMIKRNALIRRLPSVETLGCATVICSDKTGTLTKNEMTVQAVWAGGNLFDISGIGYEPKGEFLLKGQKVQAADYSDLMFVLQAGVLCNGASLVRTDTGSYKITGDPTEGAILTAAAKADIIKADREKEYSFVDEIPFDSERKKMTVIRRSGREYAIFVKGAPDVLLGDCTCIIQNGIERSITEKDRADILKMNDSLADRAMRVLAVAYRSMSQMPENYTAETLERELTFAGLIAMIDPPREEVKKAMAQCFTAGIKTVMITGDHRNTAVAIARQLGFFHEDSLALTGEELDKMPQEQLAQKVEKVCVYARVSPEHKLRVVRTWRSCGNIVAMTGDGINDAPAVKEADIGVAMGITGTDVTKEVSDMVVTDDNFASIVAAVEEGRGIYDNIKKFVHYLLSCNAGEILVMFVSSLIGLPVPLLPIHILWVNLVTDGLPALALGVDPVDANIMKRPPRPTNESVINVKNASAMLIQGAFIALCSLAAFCTVLFIEDEGIERARTAAFIVLACSQLFHSFNCRSREQSIFKIGIFTNTKLLAAVCVSFLLQMAVVYVPFFQVIFKTQPLGILDWIIAITLSSLTLWAMELIKLCKWLTSDRKIIE